MKRDIQSIKSDVQPISIDGDLDLTAWLLQQAQEFNLKTLLAYADDGVIWGQIRGKQLHTSHEHFSTVSPELRVETLQEARLFGFNGEVYFWRTDDGWQARSIIDGTGENTDFFDEWPILWGTHQEDAEGGFTLVADGAQGLRHAPPIGLPDELFIPEESEDVHRPLRLQVRHYLQTERDSGLVCIYLSRLVAVITDKEVNQ